MLTVKTESSPGTPTIYWHDELVSMVRRLVVDGSRPQIKIVFGEAPQLAPPAAIETVPLEVLDPQRAAGQGPESISEMVGEPVRATPLDTSRAAATLRRRDRIIREMREAGYDVEVLS